MINIELLDHQIRCVAQEIMIQAASMSRPSVLYRPRLSVDGNKYCALYGENLHDGCTGFGDTPAEAMADFDKQWTTANAPMPAALIREARDAGQSDG